MIANKNTNVFIAQHLRRTRSATADEPEVCKHKKISHKIPVWSRTGQRLAWTISLPCRSSVPISRSMRRTVLYLDAIAEKLDTKLSIRRQEISREVRAVVPDVIDAAHNDALDVLRSRAVELVSSIARIRVRRRSGQKLTPQTLLHQRSWLRPQTGSCFAGRAATMPDSVR